MTMHLGIIPINNQRDTQFLWCIYLFIYCNSLRVSSNLVLIIRRVNCINTVRYVGREGTSRPTYRTVTYTEWHIPDVVLTELTLLMMSARLLETRRELKYIYKELCVKLVSYWNSLGLVVNVARNELFAVAKLFNTSAVITITTINDVCVFDTFH
jgi:hypothetical protein